ncbi:hypothetical protein vseg_014915 [Gypsophila vaccaria]
MQKFGNFKLSENFSHNKLLFQHPSDLQDIDSKSKPPNNLPTWRHRRTKNISTMSRIKPPGPSTLGMAWRGSNAGINERRPNPEPKNILAFTAESKTKSYLGLESVMVLVCLTASLLILPVILPPLPPPPFLLLLVPIGIFGVLMVLAFMPSNVGDLSYS